MQVTRFQHVAVESVNGPHTTLVAGVDMAGRSWFTTSAEAAKVRMLRRRPVASVLTADDAGWTSVTGRATVLDVRRPLDGLADPIAAGLAGVALARIGLGYVDQLVGYVGDRNEIPDGWRPGSRVLVVVQHEHVLRWSSGGSLSATGAFSAEQVLPSAGRSRRHRMDPALVAGLTATQRSLLTVGGPCVLGSETRVGPVAVPGWWDAEAETVAVDRHVVARLQPDVGGACSVTIDQSSDPRPSAKVGVMLRGDMARLGDRARADRGPLGPASVLFRIRTRRITAWDGFESETKLAS